MGQKPEMSEKEVIQQHRDNGTCEIHNQIFVLFCKTCRQLCCVKCIHSENIHEGHHVLPNDEAVVELTEEFPEIQTTVEEL